MQRAEHEVACFGGGQREAYCLQVSHFADQDVIGVLAQRRAQRVGKGQRMRADLTLVDQALLGFVQELDRVLDGEDVGVDVLVDVVAHGSQRRRFARPGRTGAQNQAARTGRQLGKYARRGQLLQRQHFRRNCPEGDGGAALLVERIDAKAGEIGNAEGKVAFEHFLVGFALRVAHDVVHHGMHVLVLHRRQVDPPDVAMDPNHWRQSRRQMQIRRLVLDRKCEQFGNVHL